MVSNLWDTEEGLRRDGMGSAESGVAQIFAIVLLGLLTSVAQKCRKKADVYIFLIVGLATC